jgi:hypothetical protein
LQHWAATSGNLGSDAAFFWVIFIISCILIPLLLLLLLP